MSEQNANGRNASGRRFRLHEIILAVVLAALFSALIASDQRAVNRAEENSRQIAEVRRILAEHSRILVEVQTTLKLIASGLDIRVEPKEQAGPASTPASGEKLATKDP